MPNKTKRELSEVLEAIKGSDGVKVVILERLGVSRRTLDTYLERWATAREAFEHEKEMVGDMAEAIIFGNLHLLLKKYR